MHIASNATTPGILAPAWLPEACDGCRFQAANGEDLSAWPDNSFDAVMCASAIFMMDASR